MYSPSNAHENGIETLLDICDQLDIFHRNMAENVDLDPQEALKEKRQLTSQLQATLNDPPLEIRTTLSDPAVEMNLEERDIRLLAVLFHQRLVTDEGYLTGRNLLWVLQEGPADLLSESKRLSPDGKLMTNGLITTSLVDGVSECDVLNQAFRLADDPFLQLCAGEPIVATAPRRVQPKSHGAYSDSEEYLSDLEKLSQLAQQRSIVFFDEGAWHETVFRPGCSAAESRRRVREKQQQVSDRLKASSESERFPMRLIAKEFSLTDDEILVLSTLLFQECLRGVGSVPAIDLLRLVSSTPSELVHSRRLLGPNSQLVSKGLVHVQPEVDGKPSTGPTEIANWVVARILTPRPVSAQPIRGDDRIAFHEFLDGINCSSEFFERLG